MQMILELHKIITKGTLENAADVGVLRRSDDIVVWDNFDNKVLHRPPPSAELLQRLQPLCDFANDEGHFTIRRCGRLFCILCWRICILSSTATAHGAGVVLSRDGAPWLWADDICFHFGGYRKSKAQILSGVCASETDGNDMTYFLLHQAQVIRDAFEWLNRHINNNSG